MMMMMRMIHDDIQTMAVDVVMTVRFIGGGSGASDSTAAAPCRGASRRR